jgi:hypothetical protein
MNTTTFHNGHVITSGFVSYAFYAKCGSIYEGGYLNERTAINAVKRKLNKREKEVK